VSSVGPHPSLFSTTTGASKWAPDMFDFVIIDEEKKKIYNKKYLLVFINLIKRIRMMIDEKRV
jgi:hypothetical protein